MILKTTLLAAASVLALSAGAASAAPATAESALNMRAGPGTQYEVVATIPGGATVDVAGCTGSWCQVSFNGESGFASRSYLEMAEGGAVTVAPGYAYQDTPYYDDYDYGYDYGPSVGFYYGGGWDYGHGGRWHGGHHAGNWHGQWNGHRAGNWNGTGGHVGANQSGFAGPPRAWQRPGTGIGAGNAIRSAPTGMNTHGFRGGAAASGGMHAGGGISGGGHVGGGAPAGGAPGNGFAGSIARH